MATTTIAAITAPIATSRPATDVPRIPACVSSLTCALPLSAQNRVRVGQPTEGFPAMRRFRLAARVPRVKDWRSGSVLLGPLLAGPRAGGVGEGGARAVIHGLLGGPEDGALERCGGDD